MSSAAACPGCIAAPLAQSTAARAAPQGITLSLPGIHCAGCIAGVERTLLQTPGVRAARVNLSRKRVTIDAPGMEPEALIDALVAAGYDTLPMDEALLAGEASDAAGRALLLQVAVAGFAMMNVMMFSVAVWSGAAQATQNMFHWLAAAIAVPALAFSARVFVVSGWRALRAGRLNMDVPISLAIILATGLSLYETSQGGHRVYFDAALSLTFFLLVGRYLDHRTRQAARSASQELSALESPRALRIEADGTRRHVNVSALQVGDEILVAAGMRIPVDGLILQGSSDVDRSLLSGESLPQPASPGAALSAGEMNLSAPLTLRVTATGEDTSLRRLAALIDTAESARNRYTSLADRAAQIYAPTVHLLALVTFAGWIALGAGFAPALNIAISVLIITCPCALGLAVPAVMTATMGRLFRHGLLVKDGTALERLAEVDTVVFDKTGTLTTGIASLSGTGLPTEHLAVLAALSQASSHPISRAIAAALPQGITPAQITAITEHPGKGISATWRGQDVRLGHAAWAAPDGGGAGPGGPALAIGRGPATALPLTESLRTGAQEAMAQLQAMGLPVLILSGDSDAATAGIAARLGNPPYRAEVTPQDKIEQIKAMTDAGKRVLMVGDGLNDTAALAAAHASIAPAQALDASRTVSDFVLFGASLAEVPEAITTAQSARRRVLENFTIAAGYNLIAIPVAVLGFATPLSAAIAMSASSITVLLNALRMR
ncbi:cadmium-translocating P-type ATPase [Alphaproteobacteria bacterium KMM 3653]|uniref:Cadmium-translocating P-type ATPase n=1 Tax=Harenicola maris TaxID=2841044 RepID=A0AAP2CSI3_9RHOB|nr:cadmium-translocating P-type ATPase [Harenicola maris]